MEIKLNREEILCLIENIGDVAIMLGNDYIDVTVENQKYSKFLMQLDIPDAKWIAERYIRNIATTFDYENYVNYKFEFDEITISSKIHKNESWYGHKIGLNENEIDMFIDNRFEEAKSINNCDNNYDYDNCDDDSDDDPDEINYKIQAEMEQYMFENGKDYDDYQEPQLYDTEEDYPHSEYDEIDREIDEEEERKRKEMEDLDAQYSTEDTLVDSLNNDLDDCLSKD